MVVWQDNRNSGSSGVDIYRYNLDTKQEFAVCTHSGDQLNPAISGKYVVWQDNRNGSSNIDIYGKDIDTDTEFVICNASGNQINPAISGDIVVWEDYRSGSSVPHIYGYRISTQTEFAICTQTSYQKSPAIDGNFVVWQDFRSDSSGDIYGAYIPPPAEPSTITVLGPNGSEQFLAGSQCAITWQSSGSKIDFVKLEYSTDNGQTFSTIDANVANKDSYVSTLSYTWKPLPVVDSNKCIVRISDKAATPAASDISDNVFTIFQCDAALTADLNGDCKVDFRDFALFNSQWLDCGNPHDPDWCS
jgi:beta propeller repeat protein